MHTHLTWTRSSYTLGDPGWDVFLAEVKAGAVG